MYEQITRHRIKTIQRMFSNRDIVLKDGYEIDIRNPRMPDTADRIDSDQTGLSCNPFDAVIDSARIVFPCSGLTKSEY